MSIINGPVNSTDNFFGESISSSSNYYFASKGDTLRIITPRTISSANSTGYIGEICWDSTYIYICIDTNTWKRCQINSW